jgi:hypothetical protein
MHRLLTAMACSAILISCNDSGKSGTGETGDTSTTKTMSMNTLTDEQKAEGWQLLFDGQSTKGWHRYGGETMGNAWRVDDNSLHFDPAGKAEIKNQFKGRDVDIVTDEEFENFHLKLDWKIDTGCNSGIIFLSHEDSTKYKFMWETGPEMQVFDNASDTNARAAKHAAGDLYDIIAASKDMAKPALEWNHAEIKLLNGKLDFYLNGENIVSTTMWDDNWKKLLAASKWKDYPDFSTYKKGRIGLQDHGKKVWYRNIMIKRL